MPSIKKSFTTAQSDTTLVTGSNDLIVWSIRMETDGVATIKSGSDAVISVSGGEVGANVNQSYGTGSLTIDSTGNTDVYVLYDDLTAS